MRPPILAALAFLFLAGLASDSPSPIGPSRRRASSRDSAVPGAGPVIYEGPEMPIRVRAAKYRAQAMAFPSGPIRPLGTTAPSPMASVQLQTVAGMTDTNNSIPPDTDGAVSDDANNRIVVALNNGYAVFNKATGAMLGGYPQTLGSIWGLCSTCVFDPKVYFDPDIGRFIFVAMGRDSNIPANHSISKMLIAVSAVNGQPDVNSWNTASFNAPTNTDALCTGAGVCWGDYPQVGFNSSGSGNSIVVSANIYLVSNNIFHGSVMWVFNKTNAANNNFASVTTLNRCFDSGGAAACDSTNPKNLNSGFAIAPFIDYDGTDGTMYLVDSGWTDNSNNIYLRISKLTGLPGSPVWSLVKTPVNPLGDAIGSQCPAALGGPVQGCGFVQVANYSFSPPGVPQAGGTGATVDPGDGRIINALRRKGSLWTTHVGGMPAGSPTRASVVWYQLYPDVSVSSVTLIQNGVVDDPVGGTNYFDGSISVDDSSDVVIGMSGSSSSQFLGAYYTGRRAADAPNTMGTPLAYQLGQASYNKAGETGSPKRWGDYTQTMLDPSKKLTFWTLQEYAAPLTCPTGGGTFGSGGCWGTRWAEFGIGTPASVVSTAAVAQGTSQITWTWSPVVNATSYNVYNANTSAFLGAQTTLSPPSYTWGGLASNTSYRVLIKGCSLELGGGSCAQGSSGEGDASLGPTAATLADPAAAFTASAFISSITATVVATGNATSYRLEASTAANFTGVVTSSTSVVATKISIIGLIPSTVYHVRIAAVNPVGVANYTNDTNPTETTNGAFVAPATAAFPFVATDTIRMTWTDPNNGPGLTYQAHASPFSSFASSVTLTTTSLSADFIGLQVNTSYFFRVEVINSPTLSTAPVATLSFPPAASTTLSTFTSLSNSGLTLNWSMNGNPTSTYFQADISTRSDFSYPVASSSTYNTFATFGGLLTNTTYYARVASLNRGMVPSSPYSLASTSTLSAAPLASSAYVASMTPTGFNVYFYGQSNPPGTPYYVQFSTDSNFTVFSATVTGAFTSGFSNPADTATVSGLLSNETYYFRVAAVNNNGLATFATGFSTTTFPAQPVFKSTAPLAQSASFLRPSWSGGANAPGTVFTAVVSSDPAFGSGNQSSTTANAFADFGSLWANTTYYLEVKAKSVVATSPDSAFANLGVAGLTLSNPPGAPAQPFVSVTYTSVTVQWIPLPVSPSSATASGYAVQASTDPAFGGTVFSNSFAGSGVSQGGVGGLAFSTTYYLRVGSLNSVGGQNYTVLGSTLTLLPQVSSAAIPGGGALTLTVAPPYPQLQSIQVNIPPSTFPAGTPVLLNTNVELELPPPVSNEAQISFLGPGVGFSLTANGYQPNYPVTISMQYNLPAGVDPNRLVLARYDAVSAQWLLLPSQVNVNSLTLTGVTNHFSFFTPALVSPGTGLDAISIFPIPWEPGSDNAQLNSPTLNFTNLPAGATLRIFNVTGELVWHQDIPASGALSWTGENNNGNWVGSGTYLAVIDLGSRRTVKRIVIVR